jgi:hypothetical protein
VSAESPRYPRRAVKTLRKGQTAQAERDLAREQQELARVQQVVVVAKSALAQQRAIAEGAARAAHTATAERAFELQRAAAFAARSHEIAAVLRERLAAAEAELGATLAALAERKRALVAAHAAEQVIERDAQRFSRDERKRVEAAELDELESRRR